MVKIRVIHNTDLIIVYGTYEYPVQGWVGNASSGHLGFFAGYYKGKNPIFTHILLRSSHKFPFGNILIIIYINSSN